MGATLYAIIACLIAITNSGTFSQAQWAIDDDGCRTPDRAVGVCQPIYDCKPVLNFLETARKPLSQADRNLLFSYHCGYDQNTVKVCCPSGSINGNSNGNVDSPDRILNHRNVRLLPLKGCGVIQTDNKILNGNITALFEFPWMALLAYTSPTEKQSFKCGGTLINDRYILTAAHCITNLGQKKLTIVRLGEHDIKLDNDCETSFDGGDTICTDPVQDMTVEETIPHPQYNSKTFENDIGLLRLSKRANTSIDSVKPICLPLEASIRNRDFKKGIVTGWGRTENSAQSNVLLKVELPVMSPAECKKRYQKIAQITDRHICAGGINEKDSCGGDSGGPLQIVSQYQSDVRYVQYGVVSFGPNPCSTRGLPGVYTKISFYLDWILDNLKA